MRAPAQNSADGDLTGGGLILRAATCSLASVLFERNNATRGGAFAALASSVGSLSASTFQLNAASKHAAAVCDLLSYCALFVKKVALAARSTPRTPASRSWAAPCRTTARSHLAALVVASTRRLALPCESSMRRSKVAALRCVVCLVL